MRASFRPRLKAPADGILGMVGVTFGLVVLAENITNLSERNNTGFGSVSVQGLVGSEFVQGFHHRFLEGRRCLAMVFWFGWPWSAKARSPGRGFEIGRHDVDALVIGSYLVRNQGEVTSPTCLTISEFAHCFRRPVTFPSLSVSANTDSTTSDAALRANEPAGPRLTSLPW